MSKQPDSDIAQVPQTRRSLPAMRILLCLLVAAFAVRVIGLDRPLVGNFATKSAVYGMIARNWALGRAPFWRPTIDLSAGDERAWHLMEWPASAYLTGACWKCFGGSLDAWGRGVSLASSVAAVALTYLLARRWLGEKAPLIAAAVVAFSPVSIVYGQCFMLEASVLALSLGVLYAFQSALDDGALKWFAVSAPCLTLVVLTKIYMLVLVVPLAAMIWERRANDGRNLFFAVATITASMLPVAAWYGVVLSISPVDSPAAEYHPIGRSAIHGIPHPLLFDVGYWGRLLGDLATHVLTPVGLALACCGLFANRFRSCRPLAAVLFALPILLPLKFHAANYYYVVLLPALALATGAGWNVIESRRPWRPRTQAAIAVLSVVIALRFAVGAAYRTPEEDVAVLPAARAAQEMLGPDEPVATLHGSGVDLLYYCDRRGWALDAGDQRFGEKLADAKARGARHLVIADLASAMKRPDVSRLLSSLPVVRSGDDWRILSLAPPTSVKNVARNKSTISELPSAVEIATSTAMEFQPLRESSTAMR